MPQEHGAVIGCQLWYSLDLERHPPVAPDSPLMASCFGLARVSTLYSKSRCSSN
ncbi:hypothetical protein SCLCIDRAFT_1207758 [Scleroderma citrinum Foug A]|uniref:Uncharacterized protein n=1 Tax=Scleroderma citrinum Foug A TaxID=1036808 RepID=A0A0C3ENC5_9AGAM|nr:hypothetical protein SCLCIDRAFT_1207758 [Scleroderma citrinum Foug A]